MLPAKLRDVYDKPLMLTRGFGGCLALYPPEPWKCILEKLGRISDTDPKALALRRFYLGAATDASWDEQGRITISKYLREKAGIGSDIVVVGNGRMTEIWSLERWNAYEADELSDEKVFAIANELVPEGMTNPSSPAPQSPTPAP